MQFLSLQLAATTLTDFNPADDISLITSLINLVGDDLANFADPQESELADLANFSEANVGLIET